MNWINVYCSKLVKLRLIVCFRMRLMQKGTRAPMMSCGRGARILYEQDVRALRVGPAETQRRRDIYIYIYMYHCNNGG